MRAEIRAGIVGCGNIAANHVVAFREAGVEVVACADVDAGRAEGFARAHGIPPRSRPSTPYSTWAWTS